MEHAFGVPAQTDRVFFPRSLDGVAQFGAADVAEEDFGGAVFDDGEALVGVCAEDGFELAQAEACRGEEDERGGGRHDG